MRDTARVQSTPAKKSSKHSASRIRHIVVGYLFLLPALIVLLVFLLYPVTYGAVLSFYDYSILAPAEFTGFENFQKLLTDSIFHISLIHSVQYLLVVPIIQIFSFGLAMLVNHKLPGIAFFRAAFYVPVITAAVVVALAWQWIFDLEYGLLNSWLQSLQIIREPIAWLDQPAIALWSIMFVTFWRGLGFYMVIYLAGLQGIPRELEEAAAIDGVGRWQRLWYITIPLMMPTIAFCSIWSSIAALKVFDEVLVMSRPNPGGPANSTMVVNLLMYLTAFDDFDFGYAAAQGLVLAGIIMIFTLLNLRFFRSGLERIG
ncbi:MAG: sugar ABC transporter permease [Chloroflexota bacterium]